MVKEMRKLYLSLSLPKTGTTYLGSLLSQLDCYELPSIKEPSFFFTIEETESKLLRSVLSPGNFSRGYSWYEGLFSGNCNVADMSTQYWLRAEEVLQCASDRYQPTFIVIKREPLSQLVSYVAHLRRGHIPDISLRELIEADVEFAAYLDKMKRWNEEFDRLKEVYKNFEFIELSFDELIVDPLSIIRSVVGNGVDIWQIRNDAEKNSKSYPAFPLLNKLLFSGWVRAIGRMMPNIVYAKLVAFRKKLIKKNLKVGKGRYHEEDVKFIKEYFFQEK